MTDDFEIEIDKWVEKAGADAKKFRVAFALNLVTAVKNNTPVDTGRLRASIGVIDATSDQITIGTNVEYARRIEYGYVGQDKLGRHYDQKGVGMFAQAVARADEIAEQTLMAIQGGSDGIAGPGGETGGGPSGGGGAPTGNIVAGIAEEVIPTALEGAAVGEIAGATLKGGVVGLVAGAALDVANKAVLGPGEHPVAEVIEETAIGFATGGVPGAVIGAVVGTIGAAVGGKSSEGKK